MTRLLIPLLASAERVAGNGIAPAGFGGLTVAGPLGSWAGAVAGSADCCLVLDPRQQVVACSPSAAGLLAADPADLVGQPFLSVAELVDFAPSAGPLSCPDNTAPLRAARGDTLARSVVRIRRSDGTVVTCDAMAAPLHEPTGDLVGVLTFLREVSAY